MSLPPASSSGVYQKTRDGHAFVWNNYPSSEDEAEWSGAVDESGYATGQGTLSWFKRTRLTSLYTGTMVAGKFNGNVVNDDPDGKRYSGTYINGIKSNDWHVVGRATSNPQPSQARGESPQPTNVSQVPAIVQATASSELKSQIYQGERKSYNAELAFDGDKNTAWCGSGGGVGQWIMARFQSPTIIKGVSILGGYGVDSDRYKTNNRVRTLRVAFSDGPATNLQLEDKIQLQHFDFPRLVKTEWVKFEILGVYRGTRYDVTPVSEIQFDYGAGDVP